MRTLFTRPAAATTARCARHHSEATATAKAPRMLFTGANGQIGSDLVTAFRRQLGPFNVIASDVRKPRQAAYSAGPFMFLDVLDKGAMERVIVDNNIDTVVHLSAIMSVLGEAQPQKCIDLNVNGTTNVLELARVHNLKVFSPSTMAVFNIDAGKDMTKDSTVMNPTTVYGVTKVFLEQLGTYYAKKYDIDFRCVRYGGIISSDTLPGGGTTDYAVWMYHYALDGKKYTCPVNPDEALPMMYMPDCLSGTLQYIAAPKEQLSRNVYNIAGISFTPAMLVESIKKYVPNFEVEYVPGVANDIAYTWPNQLDDTNLRNDIKWAHEWDLDRMTRDMLEKIAAAKGINFSTKAK